MSVIRTFYPEVRLKAMLSSPNGVRAEEALARAERGLEDIREDCLAGIDEKIDLVEALSHARAEGDLERCYTISNEIFAEAGVFGLNELSAAAHSLCSLLAASDASRVPEAAVRVHVDALRALRTPSISENVAVRKAMLNELKALVRHFASPTRAITAPRA